MSGASGSRGEAVRIPSTDGVELDAHLAVPDVDTPVPTGTGVIFSHGFPSGDVWAERIGGDLPELADRAAETLGWSALALRFRGCGSSTGDFSLGGWIDDLAAAIDYLDRDSEPTQIWLCGFGTGGAISMVRAAVDDRVNGVSVAGSPADFNDWAANPNRLLAHAKRVGAITDASVFADSEEWRDQLRSVSAVKAAESLPPKPMLVLHGSEDELVPHFDARILADAHGSADLRFIAGGGHLLRHDPRAMAVLFGWLARQQAALVTAQD